MSDLFAKVLEILLMENLNPKSERRWRVLISLLVAGFGFHVFWACGYFNFLGISGFAQTKDISEIKGKLEEAAGAANDVKLKLLKRSIVDTKILQCNADSKRYYTSRLDELTDEYYQATHLVFQVPTCGDLR